MTENEYEKAVQEVKADLYHVASSLLRNEQEALDAVQECIFKGWKARKQLRKSSSFKAWIMKILWNCCNDELRKKARQKKAFQEVALDNRISHRNADYADLYAALELLEPKTRLSVLLYYMGGYSQSEIAELLELPVQKIRQLIKEGKSLLLKELE